MRQKLMVTAFSLLMAGNVSAAVIESINAAVQPGSQRGAPTLFSTNNGIGWYYTPAVDYDLRGIASRFEPLVGTPQASTDPKTVRLQLWTNRPAVGGALLREAVFNVIPRDGGDAGGTFSTLRLNEGTQYFVSVVDAAGVGINFGTWRSVDGTPQPAFGAVNLGAYWRGTDNGFATETSGSNVFTTTNGGPDELLPSAPILLFSGTPVPEPSMMIMVGTLGVWMLSRKRAVA